MHKSISAASKRCVCVASPAWQSDVNHAAPCVLQVEFYARPVHCVQMRPPGYSFPTGMSAQRPNMGMQQNGMAMPQGPMSPGMPAAGNMPPPQVRSLLAVGTRAVQ